MDSVRSPLVWPAAESCSRSPEWSPEAGLTFLQAWRDRQRDALDEVSEGESARDALGQVELALNALADVDPSVLDAAGCREWMERVESIRRRVEAVSVAVAGRLVDDNPFRNQGFFSAKTVLMHLGQLSGAEAFRRLQVARMHERLPDWRAAEANGVVGVAQCELMARVIANPRISDEVVDRDQGRLLDDAMRLPFEEFERRVRMWEALADPVGDRDRNERLKAARDVMVRPLADGGWRLDGLLPELDGAEFVEVWSWFVDAEWRSDWADAQRRLGDGATVADLARTEGQRRADASVAMARAAASAPGGPRPGAVTVDVLIDRATFEATLRGETRDPVDYDNVVCRTRSGRRVHPDDAVNAALVGHVRRVVYDGAGTVIELGRRARLFRGPSREAVMLLATSCVWIGCDRPVEWCQADHCVGWKAHGATVPRNGAPLCGRHNRLKERGFQVHRDPDGTWHITDPYGNDIA